MTDLFVKHKKTDMPLAARMRPQSIEQMVGQQHLLGSSGLLSRLLRQKVLPSMILWGPPGSGKTTLAENLSRKLEGRIVKLSAVMSGVKDIREAVSYAKQNRFGEAKTFLFIDEIHRFNKAQQDALLPFVEDGTVTLLGATTENPSFSVNTALLSRCMVLTLKQLEDEDFKVLIKRALEDCQNGLGLKGNFNLEEKALNLLVKSASGDARVLLSNLEVACDLALEKGEARIDSEYVKTAIGRRLLAYDRDGDQHYNVISAFIKSLRGSDPDAACHYLVRMLESGEDPRFILRRLVIFASEDIGNADPQAIQVAISAFQAYEFVGLPEAKLTLTQAVTYLACAPKSNAATKALSLAELDLKNHSQTEVPRHLCNAPTGLMKQLGYGKGYLYPHDFKGNYVEQQYLPESLKDKQYYFPTQNGYERFISERLTRLKH